MLPKLVQNALFIIEERDIKLMYIIIRYKTSPCLPTTCCDLAGPSHSPLPPRLDRTPRRFPRPSHHPLSRRCLSLRQQDPQCKEDLLLQLLKTESICLKLEGALCAQMEDA